MNVTSQMLLWCVVQLAAISVATVLLARFVGRRNPSAGVCCLRTGMVLVLAITILAPLQLPSWFALGFGESETSEIVEPIADNTTANKDERLAAASQTVDAAAATGQLWDELSAALSTVTTVDAPADAVVAAQGTGRSGSATAWVIGGGAGVGLLWFLIGVFSVERLRRSGEAITDARACEQLDIVAAELSCTCKLELVESESVASAATVGFFRPVILLPGSWYDWTDEELHAVLAHEVSHVRANDFAATVFGQLVVAIHFLHPFVHFLSRQLRISQELAADARASETLTGGRKDYATVLAAMALRTNKQSNLWATQAFLPAPRTMLRRIEMLRDANTLSTGLSRTTRLVLTTLLVITMGAVAGLRANTVTSETSSSTMAASTEPKSVVTQASKELSLDWVPNGSYGVLALKPNELLDHAAFQPVAKEMAAMLSDTGMKLSDIDSLLLCQANPALSEGRYGDPQLAIGNLWIIRSRRKMDWKPLIGSNANGKAIGDQTVFVKGPSAYFMPDDFTLVTGQASVVSVVARTGPRSTTNPFWKKQWSELKDKPLAFLGDMASVRDASGGPAMGGGIGPGMGASGPSGIGGGLGSSGMGGLGGGMADDGPPGYGGGMGSDGPPPGYGGSGLGYPGSGGGRSVPGSDFGTGLGPVSIFRAWLGNEFYKPLRTIFVSGELVSLSIDLEDEVYVRVSVSASNDKADKAIRNAVVESTKLVRDVITQQYRRIARSPHPEVAMLAEHVITFRDALTAAKVEKTKENETSITIEIPSEELAKVMGRFAPMIRARRVSAVDFEQVQANRNNLKQIMLGLHNYHDVTGSFPPAYSMGKDGNGKHPVSWRVLITPYIERPDIFEKYRFDEPWNSEHNLEVTSDMPAVFAHPSVSGGTKAAYFAVVSTESQKKTVLGQRISSIIDGTSSTVAIIEARRDVHWAKPDDIDWNPSRGFPSPLGGFREGEFAAALADGSVVTLPCDKVEDSMKYLFTINDRQTVRPEQFKPSK